MDERLRQAELTIAEVRRELGRGLVGQEEFVRGLLIGVVGAGHLLIEGVPGLGKTRAVNLLARICQVRFKRLQFTPDLLPSDVLGTRIYNHELAGFETVRGPIFANFVLADEINRAPAKVQSALLETMQERQVTIGLDSMPLEPPFLVFATQNPIEQEGTYPLPEAQLDRFLLKLVVPYPADGEESAIVRMAIDETELPDLAPLLDGAGVLALQAAAREVFVEERLIGYAARIVRATRDPAAHGLELARYLELGASPRGTISLVVAARAAALIDGRDAVVPDDVKRVAHEALRHRLIRSYYAEAEGVSAEAMIDQLLGAVEVP